MKKAVLFFAFMLLMGSYTDMDPQVTGNDNTCQDTILTVAAAREKENSRRDSVTDFQLFLKGLLGQELKEPKN